MREIGPGVFLSETSGYVERCAPFSCSGLRDCLRPSDVDGRTTPRATPDLDRCAFGSSLCGQLVDGFRNGTLSRASQSMLVIGRGRTILCSVAATGRGVAGEDFPSTPCGTRDRILGHPRLPMERRRIAHLPPEQCVHAD
jgi:hypothetical protein